MSSVYYRVGQIAINWGAVRKPKALPRLAPPCTSRCTRLHHHHHCLPFPGSLSRQTIELLELLCLLLYLEDNWPLDVVAQVGGRGASRFGGLLDCLLFFRLLRAPRPAPNVQVLIIPMTRGLTTYTREFYQSLLIAFAIQSTKS